MGVGGDNSWGAEPLPAYKLPYQPYHYSFCLKPVSTAIELSENLESLDYQ